MLKDYDENGKISVSVLDKYMLSDDEIKEGGDDVNHTLLYQNNEQFRDLMLSSPYYICFLTDKLYLEDAKTELCAMLSDISAFNTDMANAEDVFALIRLENDITTAYLLAISCLERDMSIGCHVRSDCPEAETNDADKYRVNIRYGKRGAAVKRVPLK